LRVTSRGLGDVYKRQSGLMAMAKFTRPRVVIVKSI
jgi:hypothetical protein